MASIYRRGRTWWLKTRVDGDVVRASLATRDEAEARKALRRLEEDSGAAPTVGPRVPYKKAAVGFLSLAAASLDETTIRRYACSIRQFDGELRDLYLDEIGYDVIKEWADARRTEDGASIATIKRDLTALSGVFDWASAEHHVRPNQALLYLLSNRRFLRERAAVIEIPSDEELARLIARAPGNFAKMIEFLDATGVRQAEAAFLRHRQVNPDRREIEILDTKSNRPRIVALDDRAWQIYESVPRHFRSDVVFWHGAGGERYANVASRFAALAADAGCTKTCHALRHRFARRFIVEGGSKEVLQVILGHASLKTTERYTQRVLDAKLQDAELHRIGRRRQRLA